MKRLFLFILYLILNTSLLPAQTIFLENFSLKTTRTWRIVNDDVMGGISDSQIEIMPNNLGKFSGKVSLENNGGFASTRAMIANPPVATYSKLVLKVKGDGKKYSFRVRTDSNFDGVSYKQDFTTSDGNWEEIELPIADFIPAWRGRRIRNVSPIVATQIRQIGFLISDKQEGAFELLVDWIKIE